jgi:hypothetical protein
VVSDWARAEAIAAVRIKVEKSSLWLGMAILS